MIVYTVQFVEQFQKLIKGELSIMVSSTRKNTRKYKEYSVKKTTTRKIRRKISKAIQKDKRKSANIKSGISAVKPRSF